MSEVGFRDDPNLRMLLAIAHALGDLRDSLVLVGGCAVGLLLTTQWAAAIRQALDVDVVAPVGRGCLNYWAECANWRTVRHKGTP